MGQYLLNTISVVGMLLGVAIGWLRGRNQSNPYRAIFEWTLLVGAGLVGIYSFIGHAFLPVSTAAAIGWSNSPFQYEVAIANLAIGAVSILGFWRDRGFQQAILIAVTIWLWGDAVGHVKEMITTHNFAPGNAGGWFWADILLPLILIISYRLSSKTV